MTPEEKINELIDSIGAVAETLKIFYDKLIDQGFDEGKAIALTIGLMRVLFINHGSDGLDA